LIYEFSSIPDIPYLPLVLVTRIFHLQLPAVSLELIFVITARSVSDISSLSFLVRESADRAANQADNARDGNAREYLRICRHFGVSRIIAPTGRNSHFVTVISGSIEFISVCLPIDFTLKHPTEYNGVEPNAGDIDIAAACRVLNSSHDASAIRRNTFR